MKRILLFTALLAALAGCTESAEVEGVISLSLNRIDAPSAGRQQTLAVQSKCDWTAECSADWVVIQPTSGQAGKSEMEITVLPNERTEKRTAQIRIGNSDYDVSVAVAVQQEAFVPSISLSQNELGCGSEGKTFEISIQASIPWNASSESDWITFSPRTSEAAGDVKMSVTVAANSTTEQRSGEIVLENERFDIRKTVKVVQSDFTPELEPDTESAEFGPEEDSVKIEIRANIPYQASCDAEWVSVKTEEKYLWIKAAASLSVDSRTAQVVLQNGQYGLRREITVVQSAKGPFLDIDKTQMELFPDFSLETGSERADNSIVRISSNIPWTASSSQAWVRPAITENESGERRMRIIAENNYSDRPRTAEITFRNERYDISRTVTVVQQAPRLRFITDNRNVVLGPTEQTLTIGLEYNISFLFYNNMWQGVQTNTDDSFVPFNKTTVVNIPRNYDEQPKTGMLRIVNADKYFDYKTGDTIRFTQQPYRYRIGYTTTNGSLNPRKDNFGTPYDYSYFYGAPSSSGVLLFENPIGYIGSQAFMNSGILKTIKIPESVSAIEERAFQGCTALTDIEFSEGLATIGQNAFSACESLHEVHLPSSIKKVGPYAFSGSGLTEIAIPHDNSDIELGYGVFAGCNSLSRIEGRYSSAPSYNTWVKDGELIAVAPAGRTFWTVTDGTRKIGTAAFYGYTELKILTLPESVTQIGSYVISDSGIETLFCKATTPPEITLYTFDGAPENLTIYVPVQSVDTYKITGGWKKMADKIKGYDF